MNIQKKLISLALLLLTTPAQAAFYLPQDLPTKPAHLDRAVVATVRLNGFDGGDCSASVVSPDGYVLTALHCIEECLAISKFAERYPVRRQEGVGYRTFEIGNQTPRGERCVHFGASTVIHELDGGVGEPEIVALGRGRVNLTETLTGEINPALFAQLFPLVGDWAILKYKLDKPAQCLPIQKTPRDLKRLWSLGFPSWTRRAEGLNSNGSSQYSSFGKIRNTTESDPVIQTDLAELPLARRRVKDFWNQSRFIVSDLDIVGGNSGGPVFDERGVVVGVTFGGIKPRNDELTGASALAHRTDAIYREVRHLLGAEMAEKIFSCPQYEPIK